MNFTEEKINEAFEKISPVIRDILLENWVSEEIVIIGKNLNIRVDKIDIIIRIVGYVVLNLISLSKLITTIQSEADIEEEKAIKISEKIDKFIFTKIREKIKITDQENKNQLNNQDNIKTENKDSQEESFSEMFQKNQSNISRDKKNDPYRENF